MNKDKRIEDYLHLYLGCEVMEVGDNKGLLSGTMGDRVLIDCSSNASYWTKANNAKPILRPLSDMSEEEILQCGKFICAIPNEKDWRYEIQKTHNTVGAKFFSDIYTSGQYFSIWNEKNKPGGIGHIEVGWYNDSKIDRRKTKDLWKVGGCHELTIYLLSKHFDLFGLIEAGLAIDATTIK